LPSTSLVSNNINVLAKTSTMAVLTCASALLATASGTQQQPHSILDSLSAAAPVPQQQHSATIWQFQYFSSSH
jgi:hypothetical protein